MVYIARCAKEREGDGGGERREAYPRSDAADQPQGITSYEIVGGRRPLADRRGGRLGAIVGSGSRGHRTAQRRGTLRATGRPVLAQLPAELLAGGRPVHPNVIAQVLDVTLEVELVLLEPADVKLLTRRPALELAGDIFLVVPDDP